MVGRDRHRSPADRTRTLAAIELTYSLAATWSEPLSDAIPPPAANVERAPLVVPVSLVGPQASNGNDMERAVGPGLLRLTVLPDAGTALTPHNEAKLAYDRNLSGLSQAVRRSWAAPTMPDRIAGDEVRRPLVDDGGDHRVAIPKLVVQLEVASSEGFETDTISGVQVTIGCQIGRQEASVRTSWIWVRLRNWSRRPSGAQTIVVWIICRATRLALTAVFRRSGSRQRQLRALPQAQTVNPGKSADALSFRQGADHGPLPPRRRAQIPLSGAPVENIGASLPGSRQMNLANTKGPPS